MIEFDEKIVGVWFLSTIEDKQDWLAAIRELEPDAKYELTYRFRYYKEDDPGPFNDDKKNWYKGTLTGTKNYTVMTFRQVAKQLESCADGPLFEVMNEGDYDDFIRRFQDQPFAHVRMLSKEEANDRFNG